MTRIALVLAALIASFGLPRSSAAQLLGLNHVWTVSGVMDTSSDLVTVVSCTYTGQVGGTIGVEVYDQSGGYVAGGSTFVAPQGTAVFATRTIAGYGLNVDLFTGHIPVGHAKIMGSTRNGVLRNAFPVHAAA